MDAMGPHSDPALAGSGHRAATTALERELKWQLEPAIFHRLRHALTRQFGDGETLEQENRFFDTTANDLQHQGMLLRLRRENGRVIMTLKRQLAAANDGLHQHEETEATVDSDCWDCPPAGLAQRLPLPAAVHACLSQRPLRSLGGFRNRRLAFHDRGEHIALDTTTFADGVVHHEIEIETDDPNASRSRWHHRLDQLGSPPRTGSESKYARYRRITDQD